MGKIKIYLIIVAVLIAIASFVTNGVQCSIIKRKAAEIIRVKHNYKVAHDSVKLVVGENGLLASRIEAQNLTVDEIKSYYQNIMADVKDMKIQLRKVTGITAFNTETTNSFHTFFRDSLVRDTVPIQYFEHHSKWLDLKIIKEGKDALVSNVSRDSLIQVVHWNRSGKFWPTRFLTKKEYFQDIKSMNPDSHITYSKWLVPVHRRKFGE